MGRLPAIIFVVLFAAALTQAFWHHAHLPEQVATRFNAHGAPLGRLPRTAHTILQLTLVIGVAVLLEGIARLNRRLPDEYINIPHRGAWLAPAHREATHRWLAGFLRTAGCLILLLFLGLFHQAYRANLGTGPLTHSTTLLVLGHLLALGLLALAGFARFWRPPPP